MEKVDGAVIMSGLKRARWEGICMDVIRRRRITVRKVPIVLDTISFRIYDYVHIH